MKNRYEVVDNVDGQPSGYELVDTSAVPPCTFAVGLREEFAVEITRRLNEGNKAANALNDLVEQLEEMGIANAPFSSVDIVDFLCHEYPKLKAALK